MLRGMTIRRYITIPFVVLIFILVFLFSLLSYLKDRHFIALYEKELTEALADRIETHLQSFFGIPEIVVGNNLEVIQTGELQLHNWEALVSRFVGQIRHTPFLTYVSAGLADGSYVGAHRNVESNEVQLFTALPAEGLLFNHYAVGADNRRSSLLHQGQPFDSRTRSWFRNSVAAGKTRWYPYYKYYAYSSLGVGVGAPVYDSQGELQGVLSADLSLSQLNSFLKTLRIGKGGVALLATPDGELLASSSNDSLYVVKGDSVRLRHLSECHTPVLREAAPLFNRMLQSGQYRLSSQGSSYLMHLHPFRSELGLEMMIGIIIPERMYLSPIQAESQRAFLLIAISALLCAALGLFLARRVAIPLEKLQAEANSLAERKWIPERLESSGVQELDDLASSFDRMARELTESLQSLEQRVIQRTQTLEEANQELQALNAVKDRFFSIVAHDLKNPFLGLVGVGEVLVEELQAKEYEDAERSARVILQSAQSGYKLLLNLLEWARAQSDGIDVRMEKLSICTELQEVLNLFHAMLNDKELVLENTVGSCEVTTDRHVLQTVLRNLISNAIKYTPRSGRILLSAQLQEASFHLMVQDTGVGMSETELKKLFRTDSMYSSLGTEYEKGTGLGLILCRELLAKVSGTLQVESQPGKGTTFTLTLPLS